MNWPPGKENGQRGLAGGRSKQNYADPDLTTHTRLNQLAQIRADSAAMVAAKSVRTMCLPQGVTLFNRHREPHRRGGTSMSP